MSLPHGPGCECSGCLSARGEPSHLRGVGTMTLVRANKERDDYRAARPEILTAYRARAEEIRRSKLEVAYPRPGTRKLLVRTVFVSARDVLDHAACLARGKAVYVGGGPGFRIPWCLEEALGRPYPTYLAETCELFWRSSRARL